MIALDTNKMVQLFEALNAELRARDVLGEIGLCGGAVMCLVFKTRASTKDIHAVFEPAREIRKAARKVARRFSLPDDWLNDAAKGFFLTEPPRQDVLSYSNLRVWAPTADYMLAMKCVSDRFDTHDRNDVLFLMGNLRLKSPDEVFHIIGKYYPRERIPAKTKSSIEEILGEV